MWSTLTRVFARPAALAAAPMPLRAIATTFFVRMSTDAAGAAPDATLCIANLPFTVTEPALQAYLESLQCGPVSRVRILTDRMTGRPRGVAFADCTKATLAQFVQTPNATLAGRQLRLDVAEMRAPRAPRSAEGGSAAGGSYGSRNGGGEERTRTPHPPSSAIFIGNLSYDASEQTLQSLFADASGVRLAFDRATGRHRGYGFVQFETVEAATAAVAAHNGAVISGRPVFVGFAGAKQQEGSGEEGSPKRSGYGRKQSGDSRDNNRY
jgi:nucleolin